MKLEHDELLRLYAAKKELLPVNPRYLAIFELRHGLTDGQTHTLKETGKKFGISGTRVSQMEARVEYEIEKFLEMGETKN